MQTTPTTTSMTPAASRTPAPLPPARHDADTIRSMLRGHAGSSAPDPRHAAEEFVSIALVQPILKQLRETTQAAEPFKPNQAERSFRSMLDAELARRMVRSSHWALVDRVEQRLRSGATTP